jgi:oligosaccharide repeat unit polymerase
MYEASLAIALICFIFTCGFYWRSPAFSVFHPLTFYLAFHGILFVFRPILAWARGYDGLYQVYQFYPSVSDKVTVILAATLGLVAFAFFSLRAGSEPMRFGNENAKRSERGLLGRPFLFVLMICGPLALYSLTKSFGASSNFEGLSLDRTTGVTINTQNIGYIMDLQLMAVPLCVIFIWMCRFRLYSAIPLALFIMLSASTGSRGPSVAAAVSAGMFYLYEKRIRYPGMRVVLGAVLVLAVFGAVGADRGEGIRRAIGLQEGEAQNTVSNDRFMEGMDFANMEYFEYLVYVIPQRSGTYDYFLDNVQVLTEPIPRVLWSGKPVGEPFRRIWLFDYGFPIGMTRSLPGEGWYALGWLGVLIWCGLWGHVLGRIYSRFVAGRQSTFSTAAYMIFLPTLVVGLRDGLLLTLVRQTGVYLTPVVLWYWLARYMGVPMAGRLDAKIRNAARTMLARRAPANGAPLRIEDPDLAKLPPAVRRRRLALGATQPDPAE